jgi:hypothetical protein
MATTLRMNLRLAHRTRHTSSAAPRTLQCAATWSSTTGATNRKDENLAASIGPRCRRRRRARPPPDTAATDSAGHRPTAASRGPRARPGHRYITARRAESVPWQAVSGEAPPFDQPRQPVRIFADFNPAGARSWGYDVIRLAVAVAIIAAECASRRWPFRPVDAAEHRHRESPSQYEDSYRVRVTSDKRTAT